MTAWVLILTLLADDSRGGSAITAVSGFSGRESCLKAAQLWLDTNKGRGSQYVLRTAVCINQ